MNLVRSSIVLLVSSSMLCVGATLGLSAVEVRTAPPTLSAQLLATAVTTPIIVLVSATPTELPPLILPTRTPTKTPAPTRTPLPLATSTATPLPTATNVPPPPPATSAPTTLPAPPRATATSMPVPAAAELKISADEQQMIAMLNAEREKAGLSLLTVDPAFQAVAQARSADMLARQYYSHNDPVTGERAAKTLLARMGITVPSSENFYSTWPYNEGFVAKAMGWLMSDKEHRDNILGPRWTVVGVGIAVAPGRNPIAVQVFGMK